LPALLDHLAEGDRCPGIHALALTSEHKRFVDDCRHPFERALCGFEMFTAVLAPEVLDPSQRDVERVPEVVTHDGRELFETPVFPFECCRLLLEALFLVGPVKSGNHARGHDLPECNIGIVERVWLRRRGNEHAVLVQRVNDPTLDICPRPEALEFARILDHLWLPALEHIPDERIDRVTRVVPVHGR